MTPDPINRLRVAVIGVGHLGEHHARLLAAMEHVDLVGVVDTKPGRADEIAAKYGTRPFRDAAASAPGKGDRRGYQMDPRNAREAEREALLDVAEGADALMVKPALAYLDVIARVKQATRVPLAAYNVSGEYSAVKAAAQRGWLDERAVVRENLLAMARAGADLLITYHAREALAGGWL